MIVFCVFCRRKNVDEEEEKREMEKGTRNKWKPSVKKDKKRSKKEERDKLAKERERIAKEHNIADGPNREKLIDILMEMRRMKPKTAAGTEKSVVMEDRVRSNFGLFKPFC